MDADGAAKNHAIRVADDELRAIATMDAIEGEEVAPFVIQQVRLALGDPDCEDSLDPARSSSMLQPRWQRRSADGAPSRNVAVLYGVDNPAGKVLRVLACKAIWRRLPVTPSPRLSTPTPRRAADVSQASCPARVRGMISGGQPTRTPTQLC